MADNDPAVALGRYRFRPTFAPLGTEARPDGTVPGAEVELDPRDRYPPDHQLSNGSAQANGASDPHLRTNSGVMTTVHHRARSVSPVESREDPTLPLNARDVGAFIVNKMIGTGIFIQPPAVLLLTQSKVEALFLWVLGFLYTLVATLLYLEFARKLPHTGGELVYLDETLPTPRLFAYTIYTFYFVLTYNTATNTMQFSNQILISANVNNPTYVPDGRLLRFIAIVALAFFCLLHYFSGHAGRTLNQILALFKLCLLIIVFVAGCVRAGHHYTPDWTKPSNSDRSSSALAFLLIVFSFTGWENATFVSGEIKNHRILRRGFVGAVVTVGVLYLLVNLVFLLAVPYSALIGPDAITAYVPLFFGGGLKARLTWSILIAFSASGSLLSVIYACARVKQVIGMSNIIPWSTLWKSTSPTPPPRANSNNRSERPTPKGGLILHAIFSVILMSATAGMYNINEAISFPGNLQAYASGWVGIFVSIGFPYLFIRPIPAPTMRKWNRDHESFLVRTWAGKLIFSAIYFAFNLYIVIVPIIPPYRNSNGAALEVRGWIYITIVVSVVIAGIVYYLLAFGYRQTTKAFNVVEPRKSIVGLARAVPRLHENDTHEPQYGFRRWVEIKYGSDKPSYVYWFFGGSQAEHLPNSAAILLWDRLMGR